MKQRRCRHLRKLHWLGIVAHVGSGEESHRFCVRLVGHQETRIVRVANYVIGIVTSGAAEAEIEEAGCGGDRRGRRPCHIVHEAVEGFWVFFLKVMAGGGGGEVEGRRGGGALWEEVVELRGAGSGSAKTEKVGSGGDSGALVEVAGVDMREAEVDVVGVGEEADGVEVGGQPRALLG